MTAQDDRDHPLIIDKWPVNVLRVLAFSVLLMPPLNSQAGPSEKSYQLKWCDEHHGQVEVRLKNNTRVDCITSTHAIEVDFAMHWYGAIGQALYYSLQTGKRPGIVLIVGGASGLRDWQRLNDTINHFFLPIDTWSILQ